MTSRAFLALALAIGPLISGCLHASARTIVDSPPLDIPAPPPRIIETVEVTPPAPLSLPEEPPRQPVSPPRHGRASRPSRAARRGAAPGRNRRPRSSRQPSREWPMRSPGPPPTLQTTPAVAEVEVARGIRVTIDRAAADLKRVNFAALNGDGRTQVRHGEAVHRSGGRRVDQAKSRARPQPGGQGAGRGGSARPTLIDSVRRPHSRVPPRPHRTVVRHPRMPHLAPALKQRHNM